MARTIVSELRPGTFGHFARRGSGNYRVGMEHIKRVEQAATRIYHTGRAAMGKLRRTSPRRWLAVIGVVILIEEAARTWFLDQSLTAVHWGLVALRWVVARPMGYGGLALIVFVLILFGAAFWEERPKRQRVDAPPRPLSDTDRRAVQDVRSLWKAVGDHAAGKLLSMLEELASALTDGRYWGRLLYPKVERLDRARREVSSILQQPATSRSDVYKSFRNFHGAYFEGMLWLAKLDSNDDVLLDEGEAYDRYQRRLTEWMDLHYSFSEELFKLHNDPVHQGQLPLHPDPMVYPFDEDYARLVGRVANRHRAIMAPLVAQIFPPTPTPEPSDVKIRSDS